MKNKINTILENNIVIMLIFSISLYLRLFLALSTTGHISDLICYAAWSNRIFDVGPSLFYSTEMFTDYPPGYLYLLWPIGFLYQFLNPAYLSGAHIMFLKLPAILCDFLSGILLFKIARTRFTKTASLYISIIFLFNPAIWFNSSVWGQVDSVYTIFVLMTCLFLIQKKSFSAYLAFGIGLLIKPQMLIFSPILLVGIIDMTFRDGLNLKKLGKHILHGSGVILILLALSLPFGLINVFSLYTNTLASYPYASVNAYNFYCMLGLNWVDQSTKLLGIPLTSLSFLVICSITFICLLVGYYLKDTPWKYPLLCAFSILTMFTFSVRMHERYLYPALSCLLLAYIYSKNKMLLFYYGLFSFLHLANTVHVLHFYGTPYENMTTPFVKIISFLIVICAILFYIWFLRIFKRTIFNLKQSSL